MDVGKKIKALRTAQGLTIKTLAEQTGLSIGYISNVERDINNPTISSLQRICQALGTDIASFFGSQENGSLISRRKDRADSVMRTGHGAVCELLPLLHRSLQPAYITLAPGGRYGETNHGHTAEEICVVTQGQIKFYLDGEEYTLEAGDCIYIDANVAHWMSNPNNSEAITFWVTFYNLH